MAACFRLPRFYEQYQKALRQAASATLTVLPQATAFVSQDVIRQFMEMGPKVLAVQTIDPVSFAVHPEALLSIYTQTQASSASQGSVSVAKLLLHLATANSFRTVMSGVHSKAASDWWLMGLGGEDLTAIIIVAHCDAFREAFWLSHGMDSNESGISVLLGLTRPFSQLYPTCAPTQCTTFCSLLLEGQVQLPGDQAPIGRQREPHRFQHIQYNVAFVL